MTASLSSRPSGSNCGSVPHLRGLREDFDDNPEAGWIVAADHPGQGIGREAMRAVLGWFDREYGPRRVICRVSPENERSMKLAARLGFTPIRDTELPDNTPIRLFDRM